MARPSPITPSILRTILKPIARLCVRYAVSYRDFCDLFRLSMVEVAREELLKQGQKVNDSRVSVATGIRREHVKHILNNPEEEFTRERSVPAQVVTHWRVDPRFTTKNGQPRTLTSKGNDSEFAQLVESVSQHVRSGSVRQELLRLGIAVETPKGLKLTKQVFANEEDIEGGFELMADDVETLMGTVCENLLDRQPISNLHIRTEFDNIVASALPTLRRWLLEEGKSFHRRAREMFSRYDKDIAPELLDEEGGCKVVLSAFSLTPVPEQKETDSDSSG